MDGIYLIVLSTGDAEASVSDEHMNALVIGVFHDLSSKVLNILIIRYIPCVVHTFIIPHTHHTSHSTCYTMTRSLNMNIIYTIYAISMLEKIG